jgi:hypothetical protein
MDNSPMSEANTSGPIVRQLTESQQDAAAWEALVSESPTANRFLRGDCLEMLARTDAYGTRFVRMGVFSEAGTLRGGWALPYREHLGLRYSTYFDFFYAGPMLCAELETGSVHAAKERMETLAALGRAASGFLPIIEMEGHPRLRDARGLHYEGWTLRQLYTHVWNFSDPDAVWSGMNRERRRLIRRAEETLRFAVEEGPQVSADFIALYRRLIRKFDWVPLGRWDGELQQRLEWLCTQGSGLVYGARDAEGALRAAVILLLSPEDRTVYLWRCAYDPEPGANTMIPALYWNACRHVFGLWGAPMTANFGGSPRMSLSHFKDYLGAEALPHLKLLHDKPGLRVRLWRRLRRGKEDLRRIGTRLGVMGALVGRNGDQERPE